MKNRGQHCGDIDLVGYLANVSDPVPLVLDLRIAHDRFGISSDPSLNGNLHYPNNIDKSLNETAASSIPSMSGRLHSEFIRLLFLQAHRETDRFFAASGVQLVKSTSGLFHFHRGRFRTPKVSSTFVKTVVLRITLNIDGTSLSSRTHTHP